jgi:hypothetical protein
MKSDIAQDRNAAFRRVLVNTARSESRARRRPSARTTIIGIGSAAAAFALAGALTGGAIASASTPSPEQVTIANANQAAGVGWIVEEDSRLLGQPFTGSGTGKVTVDLGARPAGANAVVEASVCSDPGTFNEGIDGAHDGQTICDSSDTGIGNVGTGDYPVTTNGSHTFTFSTTPGAHYSVWLSWIYYPTLTPSAAEKAAIADGIVTRAEYVAAFNQYLGCMAAAGESVTGYDESTPIIHYTLSNGQVSGGVDHRCYETQFRAVDELWQTENGGINQK